MIKSPLHACRTNSGISIAQRASMVNPGKRCIVCNSSTSIALRWPMSVLKPVYEANVGSPFPEDACCPDYDLLKCSHCGLQFADPCEPGNSAFYRWVTGAPDYYGGFRWEWGETERILKEMSARSLLDIGCGTGSFLGFIARNDIDAMGLDTLEESVTRCRQDGHRAACMTLEEYLTSDQRRSFDVVTAFHCLEHVADPVGLVKLMAQALNPGGRIIVSFPYSPASWEAMDVSCMNMPPHHLTRWNKPSIHALGAAAGLETKVATNAGVAATSLPKSIYWLFRSTAGLEDTAGLGRTAGAMCAHPSVLVKAIEFYLARDRVDGVLAGDTAFVEFGKGSLLQQG